ncbi:NADH-quinone oxidoreductase subunit N [bacterium]|nr:NADH-quinone oxidoreductase subunit N [bacterium]
MNLVNLIYLSPEIILIGTAFFLLFVDLFLKGPSISYNLAILGTVASLAIETTLFGIKDQACGVFTIDPFSVFIKVIFLSCLLVVLLLSKSYFQKAKAEAEYCFILLLSTVGMMGVSSACEMITFYVSLELISVSSYILVSFLKDKRSVEAGIKYLLFSALSSAIFLYGMSLLYGMSGTTSFAEASRILLDQNFNKIQVLTIILIFSGFLFKADIVPCHAWVPDVYEGAPTPITAWLATGSKIAGFVAIIRFLIEPLGDILFKWPEFFFILACATIIVGNLSAIGQKNIKRLLAYSSISHAGYIMIGLCAYSALGTASILFYLAGYSLATLGAFSVVCLTKIEQIEGYNGLYKKEPLLAGVMLLSLASLAGLPPFIGFAGKFFIFSAALEKGLLSLAIVGVLFSVVSVYYYFSVIKAIYFGEANEKKFSVPFYAKVVLSLILISLILFGLLPDVIMDKAQIAISSISGL